MLSLWYANKTHFHKKGCALGLFLKVRVYGTQKWPITWDKVWGKSVKWYWRPFMAIFKDFYSGSKKNRNQHTWLYIRVVKSSQPPAKIAAYLVCIGQLLCQAFLYGRRLLNKISLDWLPTSTTQLSTSKLSDNPVHVVFLFTHSSPHSIIWAAYLNLLLLNFYPCRDIIDALKLLTIIIIMWLILGRGLRGTV